MKLKACLWIVPLALYFKDGRAKVEIALAKGKKSYDKRHSLAERQANREKEQALGRRVDERQLGLAAAERTAGVAPVAQLQHHAPVTLFRGDVLADRDAAVPELQLPGARSLAR